MSFIEVKGLGDIYEDEVVPEGSYDLRIRAALEGRNKKDTHDQITVMIDIENLDIDNSATIFHYLTFPAPDDEDDKRRMFMRNITRFFQLFNVKFEKNGINAEDMVGCTADQVTLTQEEYEGNVSNKIRLPRLN